MKGFTPIELLVWVFIISIIVALSASFGDFMASQRAKAEAVSKGVAEYYIVDQASGKTEFRWKTAATIIDVPPWQKFVFTNNGEVFIVSIDKK